MVLQSTESESPEAGPGITFLPASSHPQQKWLSHHWLKTSAPTVLWIWRLRNMGGLGKDCRSRLDIVERKNPLDHIKYLYLAHLCFLLIFVYTMPAREGTNNCGWLDESTVSYATMSIIKTAQGLYKTLFHLLKYQCYEKVWQHLHYFCIFSQCTTLSIQ